MVKNKTIDLLETFDDFRNISECVIDIDESSNEKTYYIDGIWAQFELWNGNDRWYQKNEGVSVAEDFNTKRIPKRDKIFGELDHSKDSAPQFSRMSHIFENELTFDGNDMRTRARVLSDTKEGQTLRVILDEKLKYGVSTKGVGMLSKYKKNGRSGKLVSSWGLKNVGDVVVDQSAPNATPQAIIEMVMQNDERMEKIFGYEAVSDIKNIIKKTKIGKLNEKKLEMYKRLLKWEIQ